MLNFYRFREFQKHASLYHVVTKKSTTEPYDFSLALHTGENSVKVISNRTLLTKTLKKKETLHYIVAKQTHGEHIKVITEAKNKGWSKLEDAIEDCDALITNIPNVILSILTADCVPILLYDKEKKVVSAVHAGWKGTQVEIVLKTVQKMKAVYGCEAKDIIASVAPSIGICCYEVGKDVAKYFFNVPKSLKPKGNKYMLDLPYINQQQLLKVGLDASNIEMSKVCTSCEVTQYFSYRKENGCTGRFMSMIGLI